MKEYPRNEDFNILLAEDVRVEANGKFSLLGFYPGHEINVKEFGATYAIPLAFMLLFAGDAAGDYNFSFELVNPSGKSLGKVNARINKLPKRGVVQVVKLLSLPVTELGNWKVNVRLDDIAYSRMLSFTNNLSYFSS